MRKLRKVVRTTLVLLLLVALSAVSSLAEMVSSGVNGDLPQTLLAEQELGDGSGSPTKGPNHDDVPAVNDEAVRDRTPEIKAAAEDDVPQTVKVASAVDTTNTCDGYDTSAISKELRYVGPHQTVTRKGKLHFRCFNAQHWEDLYMFQNFFANVTNGFFIELGALDGYSYSVTYFFEKFLSWQGLLIEASPQNHNMYRARMKMLPGQWRRQGSEYVQAAVCSEPKELHYVAKEGTGAGILEFMPQDQQERNKKMCTPETKEDGAVVAVDKKNCVLKPIRCVHLGDLLREKKIPKIDLFILDVEGAEWNVLQTLRLDEIPIHFFLIELDGKSPEKDAKVRCILRRHHYEPVGRLDLNEIWQKRDFPVEQHKASYTRVPPKAWDHCFKTPVNPSTFFVPDNQVVELEVASPPRDKKMDVEVGLQDEPPAKTKQKNHAGEGENLDKDFEEFPKVNYYAQDDGDGGTTWSSDVLFWAAALGTPLFVATVRGCRRRRRL